MEMAVIVFLAILASMASPSMAVDYPISWSQGVDYSAWGNGKTINAGDTLKFTYTPGFHSVDELSSKSSYDSCNTSGAKSDGSGTTKVTLDKPSTTYYFACGVPGHCKGGMKLAVTTSAAADTSNNNPTSSPPTASDGGSSTASPATPLATSSPPPPPDGGSSTASPATPLATSSPPPPPAGSGAVSNAAAGVKGGFAVMLGLALLALLS